MRIIELLKSPNSVGRVPVRSHCVTDRLPRVVRVPKNVGKGPDSPGFWSIQNSTKSASGAKEDGLEDGTIFKASLYVQ
jgi:hypothetical protein